MAHPAHDHAPGGEGLAGAVASSVPIMAKYDPDGNPNPPDHEKDPDGFREWVDSYLADPTAEALADDMGRAFRLLPAADQIATLGPMLLTAVERHAEMVDLLANLDDEPVELLLGRQKVLAALADHVEGLRRRIAHLCTDGWTEG